MTELRFSNRELKLMFEQLQKQGYDSEQNLHSKLEIIEEQTKKTNGRVKKLEIWQAGMVGAITIISFLVSFIIFPIATEMAKKWIGAN